MTTEVQIGNVGSVPAYGLRRSGYYAGRTEMGQACCVALACEGVVWCRLWAARVMEDNTIRDDPSVAMPPAPPFAWLGNYDYAGHHFTQDRRNADRMN